VKDATEGQNVVILVSSILRFSISETGCTTLRNTPSLPASIASMRLYLLTFHILLRGRDLAYNTLVPFNYTFRKDRKLHKIKTAKRLQNVKDATEGQNVVACHSRR
jgi:hypothetical protein